MVLALAPQGKVFLLACPATDADKTKECDGPHIGSLPQDAACGADSSDSLPTDSPCKFPQFIVGHQVCGGFFFC